MNPAKTKVSTVDIPTGWDPRTKQQRRVALADFSAAPWRGFEKSERGPNSLAFVHTLCTARKENQRIFAYIKCSASPMDFSDCKYDHQDADFQDEAIWDVMWLADK